VSENKDHAESFENPQDPTRRQWILRLGEFVALAGVSGFVPELAATLAAQQSQPGVSGLPPGLYEPSQDHLVHALSSGGKNWTPPPGSETDYVQPTSGPYRPRFFSDEEFPVITRLMEILLGKLDSSALSQATQWFDLWLFSATGVRNAAQHLDPMHRVLAVAFYGEESVRELETADPQSIVRAGLKALHDLSAQTYGKPFLQLTDGEQVEILTTAGKAQPASELRKLFELTRTEAIRGYYTSAEGLKELDYRGNAYYGDSPGCEVAGPMKDPS
jgi:hypothetical protein